MVVLSNISKQWEHVDISAVISLMLTGIYLRITFTVTMIQSWISCSLHLTILISTISVHPHSNTTHKSSYYNRKSFLRSVTVNKQGFFFQEKIAIFVSKFQMFVEVLCSQHTKGEKLNSFDCTDIGFPQTSFYGDLLPIIVTKRKVFI